MKPSKQRIKEIQRAEKDLAALSNDLQSDYFDSVWRVIGPITLKDNPITLAASNDVFIKSWQRIVGRGISKFLKEELRKQTADLSKYYSQYTPPVLSFDEIDKIVKSGLTQQVENFATAYASTTDVAFRTRSFTVGLIQQGLSIADIKTGLSGLVLGDANKLGIVDNYNFVKLRINDTFAEYDRRVSDQYATQLQLNYFIYNGGEIKTTRDFCEERNNNVYTREEALEWNTLDWQGKKPGHNVLNDAGGYNCRHYLDWISYELAKQLRPDIQRSKFDINGL